MTPYTNMHTLRFGYKGEKDVGRGLETGFFSPLLRYLEFVADFNACFFEEETHWAVGSG